MSTSPPFSTDRPFPFCVPQMTEEEIVAYSTDFFGGGEPPAARLTGDIAFAMALYWNLERVDLTLTGRSGDLPEPYDVDASIGAPVFNGGLPSPPDPVESWETTSTPPKGRVCGGYFVAFREVVEDAEATHEYAITFQFAQRSFVYNTTTEEYNIIFSFEVQIGEVSGTVNADSGDASTTITLFGQDFTLWLNLATGGPTSSFITVTDFTPTYFDYVP